jgi:CRP-like cAMP-binding protein
MSDTQSYPLTGRFLQGRLRYAMDEGDKARLEELIASDEVVRGEQTLLERGQLTNHSTLLVDGFVLRTIKQDGRTFVVGLHLPGDFVDLHAFALKRLDHDIVVIGGAHLAYIPHDRLKIVMRDDPRLARILWFASLLDSAIHRTWILKLEQLRADARLAHLLSEIWRRLEMVELARADGFASPLTQTHLAAMCGISVVHANRALRDLRMMDLGQFRRGRLFSDDRAALERHGGFTPDYLYGERVLHMQMANRVR